MTRWSEGFIEQARMAGVDPAALARLAGEMAEKRGQAVPPIAAPSWRGPATTAVALRGAGPKALTTTAPHVVNPTVMPPIEAPSWRGPATTAVALRGAGPKALALATPHIGSRAATLAGKVPMVAGIGALGAAATVAASNWALSGKRDALGKRIDGLQTSGDLGRLRDLTAAWKPSGTLGTLYDPRNALYINQQNIHAGRNNPYARRMMSGLHSSNAVERDAARRVMDDPYSASRLDNDAQGDRPAQVARIDARLKYLKQLLANMGTGTQR